MKRLLMLVALAAAPVMLRASVTQPGKSLPAAVSLGRVEPEDRLVIAGLVHGTETTGVTLRIDDKQSRDYGSRVNLERMLPAGPFRWEVQLHGLKTSSGRRIDLATVQEARFFSSAGGRLIELTQFGVEKSSPLGDEAIAYSFGAADAPCFQGFERVTPASPMIERGKPTAVERTGPDPLIANGISGIERLVVPWTKGRAHVTLWTEDPGDWETLPHPLERRIRVNGLDVLYERLRPEEWLKTRYLRGLLAEHTRQDDAWTAYGARRGGRISFNAAPSNGGIVIELAGDSPPATFLNAIVVEPASSAAAAEEVEARRARWYRETWPVVQPKARDPKTPGGQGRAVAAPGSGVRVTLAVTARTSIARPSIRLSAPTLGDASLGVTAWAALPRLERDGAGGTVLALSETTLIGDPGVIPLKSGEPRTYELWITAPSGAKPGTYRGEFAVLDGNEAPLAVPIEIEVVDVALPAVQKPSGFYLDEAPQWAWFWGFDRFRPAQTGCDLALLKTFDITGNAPALATPIAEAQETFLKDMALAAAHGTAAPWLAYAPAKRLFDRVGRETGVALLAKAEDDIRRLGLPAPVWSVADEPANADSKASDLKRAIEAIRKTAPFAKLAAQLNSDRDRVLAPLFDVAIINQGLGLEPQVIDALRRSGPEVWIYNTGRPRVTAGLWLWRTSAARYVQWHARMPTADPFDPLDGREGDVQMILPSAGACPLKADIHRDILEMAEGLVDQRWLQWLDQNATPGAKALADDLRARQGAEFSRAAALDRAAVDSIRQSIVELAR